MFLLGTSWKMNKTRGEARAWVERVHGSGIADAHGADAHGAANGVAVAGADGIAAAPAPPRPGRLSLFVVPPFTAIEATLEAIVARGATIAVGAQNVHEAREGARTGEVSATMLAELGCRFVEIGHSERRRLFAETDEAVAAKVRAVLDHGMTPLVCVGDTREERDAHASLDSVLRQARIALSRCTREEQARCRLAYEPVWAIGVGGEAASPDDVATVHGALRERCPDTPLLYGGSVDADNAPSLARLEDVDGLFVGRAALDPDGFVAIARAVSEAVAAAAAKPFTGGIAPTPPHQGERTG